MMKMKTICACVMAALMLCGLSIGAVAEEAATEAPMEVIETVELVRVTPEPAPEESPVAVQAEEAAEQQHTAVFCDRQGNEIHRSIVEAGARVTKPADPDAADGYVFVYWFDASLEVSGPFDFDAPLLRNVILFPFFVTEEESAQGVLDEQEIVESMLEEQAQRIILQILDAANVMSGLTGEEPPEGLEELPAETEAEGGHLAAMSETELQTVMSILGVDGDAYYEEMINSAAEEAVDKNVQVALAIEESADTLIAEILSGGPEEAEAAGPEVEITHSYEGELTQDTEITVTATVTNVPEGAELSYQWQNDAAGEFEDVEGATERTYTYRAGEYGEAGCRWRVRIEVAEAE